jgi:hypothetical protein
MCTLCGVLMKSHWAEDGGRRQRLLRERLLQRVVAHFGLGLSDWGGRVYVVHDRKGRSVVVDDVGSLWAAAEALAGRKLDPLDPGLVEALGGGDG